MGLGGSWDLCLPKILMPWQCQPPHRASKGLQVGASSGHRGSGPPHNLDWRLGEEEVSNLCWRLKDSTNNSVLMAPLPSNPTARYLEDISTNTYICSSWQRSSKVKFEWCCNLMQQVAKPLIQKWLELLCGCTPRTGLLVGVFRWEVFILHSSCLFYYGTWTESIKTAT